MITSPPEPRANVTITRPLLLLAATPPLTVVPGSAGSGTQLPGPPAPKSTAWVYVLAALMPESASPAMGAAVNTPAPGACAANRTIDTASVRR